MRAIHWLRSRQEGREISYWLSFVSFETKDRSLNNRIYLVYLLAFFSVWWFITLVWFAEAGATLLTIFSSSQPVTVAVSLELIVLFVWFTISFIQDLRRSPVSFSEEDAFLVCQMPVDPRKVVLRWLAMPWVKSLIPFLIFALVLGFSLAEISLSPGEKTGQDLLEYAWVGLRAVLAIIPLHLTLFSLNWSAGIWFMGHQRKWRAGFLPIVYFLIISLLFLSGLFVLLSGELPAALKSGSTIIEGQLRVGFGDGDLSGRLMNSWLVAIFSLIDLFFGSRRFSLSWAAQETKLQSKIQDLKRYGFFGLAREIQKQSRLGIERKAIWLPTWQDAMAMPWKGILQYLRTFELSALFKGLIFISSMMGLVFLPNLSGRIFLVLTWTLQAGKFLTARLRHDLTRWTITKQLPIKSEKWILAEFLPSAVTLSILSLAGLTAGSLAAGQAIGSEVIALPGMIAIIAGISAIDIFRNSRINLLISGHAPGVSELGVILGTICAGIPVLVYTAVPGLAGALLAFLVSMFIGSFAVIGAIKAYRMIQ